MVINRTDNRLTRFPAGVAWSHPRSGRLRFGNTPDVSDENLTRLGNELHGVLKEAERHPGKFRQAVEMLLKGDTGLGRNILKTVTGVLAQIPVQCSSQRVQGPDGLEVHIQSGPKKVVYKNRINIFSCKEMSFQDYLKLPQVFGDENRVIVSFTGWTKPPAHYLTQNDTMRQRLETIPKAEWPNVAEGYYVSLIKRYLSLVVQDLSRNGYSKDNLGFVYGVTNEGIDRAIEEFCKENRIKCAGVTTFDWIDHKGTPDEGDRPPIYLVNNAREFGRCLSAFKVVVAGGRNFAATVDQSGRVLGLDHENDEGQHNGYKAIAFDHKLIPANLMWELGGINVDPVVLSDKDQMTTVVENAPALLEANPATNPNNWPDIRIDYDSRVPRCVQVLSQVLARELDNQGFLKSGIEFNERVRLQDALAKARQGKPDAGS